MNFQHFQVPKLHEGTLNTIETDQIEFANDFFIKDQPDLIGRIKRKDTKRQMTPTPKVCTFFSSYSCVTTCYLQI